jgi:hypothetical protein
VRDLAHVVALPLLVGVTLAATAAGHATVANCQRCSFDVAGVKRTSVQPGVGYELQASRGSVAAFGAGSGYASPGLPLRFVADSSTLILGSAGPTASVQLSRGASAQVGRPPQVAAGTLTADVAVIGGDAGGLGAAVTAARRGLRVVLVSAASAPGGMLTVGGVGFADGNPTLGWPETLAGKDADASIPAYTGWSTAGGVWRDFQDELAHAGAPGYGAPVSRWTQQQGVVAAGRLTGRLRSLRVLNRTSLSSVIAADGRILSATVTGGWTGSIRAKVWIDGSDDGQLVGAMNVPAALGVDDGTPNGSGSVMAYAYRWTAVEGAGVAPQTAPPYYAINRLDYRGATAERWPDYQRAYEIPAGSNYLVNPFRLFNASGRLSGAPTDLQVDPATGAPTAPGVSWIVNGAMNDASSTWIARLLASNPTVSAFFASRGIANPYSSGAHPEWSDVDWVQFRAPLNSEDRQFLVSTITDAVRAKALGVLWYVRSGDMLQKLRTLPGGSNLALRSDWGAVGVSPDGLSEVMYRREGLRVAGVTRLAISDLCPTYSADSASGVCQTGQIPWRTSVAIADYSADIHGTANERPSNFALVRPYGIPITALIPAGYSNVLVTGAVSADRPAYAALRVDTTRLMLGTAAGEAASQAVERGVDLSRLDIPALRAALAQRDRQASAFNQWSPRWDGGRWRDDGVASAVQRLYAYGGLRFAWASVPDDGSTLVDPREPLSGRSVAKVMEALTPAGTRHLAAARAMLRRVKTVRARPALNVGDLYVALAASTGNAGR